MRSFYSERNFILQVQSMLDALAGADVACTVSIDTIGTVTVYVGDDYETVRDIVKRYAIAYDIQRMRVGCSAHYTGDARPGTDMPMASTDYIVAMDYSEQAARLPNTYDAIGIYGGKHVPALISYGTRAEVMQLHQVLRDTVPGFDCMAVMTEPS